MKYTEHSISVLYIVDYNCHRGYANFKTSNDLQLGRVYVGIELFILKKACGISCELGQSVNLSILRLLLI